MHRYGEYLITKYFLAKRRRDERQIDRSGREHQHAVLIICHQPLGDTVTVSPFLRELRRNVGGDVWITMLCSKGNEPLLHCCPYVNEVIAYEAKAPEIKKGIVPRLARQLQAEASFVDTYLSHCQYDYVFIPAPYIPDLPAAWIAYCTGAAVRVGFTEALHPSMHREYMGMYDALLTQVLARDTSQPIRHVVEMNLDMLRTLHMQVEDTHMEVWADEEDRTKAKQLVQAAHVPADCARIIVNLSTSSPKKDWPVERYVQVCQAIAQVQPVQFILLGAGERAAQYSRAFCTDIPDAVDFTNKTSLRVSCEIIRQCDYYLGGDTGPMHMAAACGLAGVAIFMMGQDIQSRLGDFARRLYPWGCGMKRVQPQHMLPGCEHGCVSSQAHCIKQVSVAEVTGALLTQLQAE